MPILAPRAAAAMLWKAERERTAFDEISRAKLVRVIGMQIEVQAVAVIGQVLEICAVHTTSLTLQPPRCLHQARSRRRASTEDGNHVVNNRIYRYRPQSADWMAEKLGARLT